VPTHEELPSFLRDYLGLSAAQQQAFREAVRHFSQGLESGQMPTGLRIKGVRGYPSVWEMTWAGDGRATFSYGRSVRAGNRHVVWRRIGTHDIFRNP
jgi:hypothetical protein